MRGFLLDNVLEPGELRAAIREATRALIAELAGVTKSWRTVWRVLCWSWSTSTEPIRR